jgi:flagella basal body P-ring formation protein FlgA
VQWWSLKAYAPVVVARRALRAGEAVRTADIALEERDIAGSGGALLDADPGLAEARWRATRFVQPGAALRRSDLEPAPEVLRGQQVRVSVVSGSFTIETTGVAREEGRLGAVIGVVRPARRSPISRKSPENAQSSSGENHERTPHRLQSFFSNRS